MFFNGSGKNTINNSQPQKRQQKQHEQQDEQHTTRKPALSSSKNDKISTKSNKSSANGCVFHRTATPKAAAKERTNNMRAKRCGSRRWGEEESFRLCSRLFFLDTSKICNNWSLIFSEVMEGQINCKIVPDILQKATGFHTTAREPKRA